MRCGIGPLLLVAVCLGSAMDGTPTGLTKDFLLEAGANEIRGKRIALLVGVEYPVGNRLEYTANDVQEMKKALGDFGFEFIVKTGREATTKAEILKAITELEQKSKSEDDQVIVFFSGHGMKSESGEDLGFLMPSDGHPNALIASCLGMSMLQDLSKSLRARHVLFIIDCCYSGIIGGFSTMDFLSRNAFQDTGAAKAQFRQRARQVLTAGQSGERTIMLPDRRLSAFTVSLVDGLGKVAGHYRADASRDGIIMAREIARYVSTRIQHYAPGAQNPGFYDYSTNFGECFLIPKDYSLQMGGQTAGGTSLDTGGRRTSIPVEPAPTRNVDAALRELDSINTYRSNLRAVFWRIQSLLGGESSAIGALIQIVMSPITPPLPRVKAAFVLGSSHEAMLAQATKEKVVKALIELIDKVDDLAYRREMVQKLSRLEAKGAEDMLIRIIKVDESDELKQEAIRALKVLGKNKSVIAEVLMQYLWRQTSAYSSPAVEAIEELELKSCGPALLEFYERIPVSGTNLKSSVIRCFGRLKVNEAVPKLEFIVGRCEKEPTQVLMAAANVLLDMGRPTSRKPLRELLPCLGSGYGEQEMRNRINKFLGIPAK